jgi:hypothetical protein
MFIKWMKKYKLFVTCVWPFQLKIWGWGVFHLGLFHDAWHRNGKVICCLWCLTCLNVQKLLAKWYWNMTYGHDHENKFSHQIKIQCHSIIKICSPSAQQNQTKQVLITFCDYEGVVHQKYALQLQTVNQHLCWNDSMMDHVVTGQLVQ